MSSDPERPNWANKAIENMSYRPFLELECLLCRAIGDGSIALDHPLVVVDAGAARGFDPRWEVFGDKCAQIGFEPDEAEARRLREQYGAQQAGQNRKYIEPVALWRCREVRTLNITRDADASSFYVPNDGYFSRLPNPSIHEVVRRAEVHAIALDEYRLPLSGTVDVIKLDVQGAELDVLRGSAEYLDAGALAVIAETMFTPQYQGQPLFPEIHSFLTGRGFELFDIDHRRWRRKVLPSQFDGIRIGQVAYADVLYLKDPVSHANEFCRSGLEREKLLKLVALAEFFSVPDFAVELLEYARSRGFVSSGECEQMSRMVLANRIARWADRNRMPT